MKILTKYTLKEFIPPFLLSLLCFTLILLLDEIFRLTKLFVRKGISPIYLIELLIYVLPATIVVTVPMSTLVGILMALGRLTTDNEIAAMRSHGVSFQQLLTPILIASAVLSVADLVFMDSALPWGNSKYVSLKRDIMHKNPAFVIEEGIVMRELEREGKIWMFDLTHPETGEMINVRLWDGIWSGNPRLTFAKNGTITFDQNRGKLNLIDGKTYELIPGEKHAHRITNFTQNEISLDFTKNLERSDRDSKSPRSMSIRDLRKRIGELRSHVEIAGEDSFEEKQLRFALVEFHKKFSIPFACVFFGLIGVPLGMMVKKSGRMVGFGLGTILILVYYLLLQIGQDTGRDGTLSPLIAMWLPNFVIGSIGLGFVIHFVVQNLITKKIVVSGQWSANDE